MEFQQHLVGKVLDCGLDQNGVQYYVEILEEYIIPGLQVALSQQTDYIVSRYWACVDTLFGRSQIAENRRDDSTKMYSNGIVPDKLSSAHLRDIAPNFDKQLFKSLKKKGITTRWEYDDIPPSPSGGVRDVNGCTRHKIDSFHYIQKSDLVKELEISGPVFCSYHVHESFNILKRPNSAYFGLQKRLYKDDNDNPTTQETSKPMLHANMCYGVGKCRIVGDTSGQIHEYAVTQNTWGHSNPETVRVGFNTISYLCVASLVDYK